MEPKKLDDSQLKLIRDVTEGDQDLFTGPETNRRGYRTYVFDLLGHIAALEVEHTATMQQVVKDAWKNGDAVSQFIDEQTDRIEALEAEVERKAGYAAFLYSCAKSGEQPETYEWYLNKANG